MGLENGNVLNNLFQENIHDSYHIKLVKNGKIEKEVTIYNNANAAAYINSKMIYKLVLLGSPNRTRFIEPYADNDVMNYWERDSIPTYSQGENGPIFISGYKATVFFPGDSDGGTITGVQLETGISVLSAASIRDVEGNRLYMEYGAGTDLYIDIHIFFKINLVPTDEDEKFLQAYPIVLYGPEYSMLCGCSGSDKKLLEAGERYPDLVNMGSNLRKIPDGFFPQFKIERLGITKSPIPSLRETGYFQPGIKTLLCGGINSFQTFELTDSKNFIYKNATPKEPCWKGLITAIVIPSIGLIDLTKSIVFLSRGHAYQVGYEIDATTKSIFGVGHLGILRGSKLLKKWFTVPPQNSAYNCVGCFIPEEYSMMADKSLISLTKNAFYRDKMDSSVEHLNVVVKRYGLNANGEYIDKEIPMNEPFFSDLFEDKRYQRSLCFSHHVPLTVNDYCGAETVIPCTYGPILIGTDSEGHDVFDHYYGYYITYTSPFYKNGKGEEYYLTANYAVAGEVTVRYHTGALYKMTFPYILEYSYDGNDFFVAADFSKSGSQPYQPLYFEEGAISAPIWRLKCNLNGAGMLIDTTFGDPYVSAAAVTDDNENHVNGYDPLFIFVGYDEKEGDANARIANMTFDEQTKVKLSISQTPKFHYGVEIRTFAGQERKVGMGFGFVRLNQQGEEEWVPGVLDGVELSNDIPEDERTFIENTSFFETQIPYLCHKNDSYFISGNFKGDYFDRTNFF